MAKKSTTRRSLLMSAVSLILCVSMLIGSTFAWFTDSVTTGENVIQSGNLDIEMYWTDDLDSGNWYNVEDDAHNTIFSYDNWEPGYTDVKYIKLVNNGSLAMNYKLTLTPQGAVGKLAEVINVYFADSAVTLNDRDDLDQLGSIGLLNNVLNGGATAGGTLLPAGVVGLHPAGETIMTIAMNMITTAGNDYQNQNSGEFTITALATQAPYEQDSFGSDYDTNAEYPVELVADKATAAVTPVDGKVPAGGVTLTGANITAFVPEGALMAAGADKLTLSVTPMEHTTSDIKVVNDEILIPVDVHISGLAENNTVPVIIGLGEVLPKYLNMGNYHLFHVEDGVNNEMTLVDSEAQLTQHNAFTYDPMTGEITVAMASFSEVALVADTSKAWKGEEDNSWYDADAAELKIANADQLYAFAKIVGGMGYTADDFSGQTIKLLSDINLNGGKAIVAGKNKVFYPIGYYNNQTNIYDRDDGAEGVTGVSSTVSSFSGTFDGNGHTIANFYQNTWEMFGDYNSGYSGTPNYYKDAMGLFGYVNGGTVKNLTVDSFESDGEFTPTGVIAAYADGDSKFENIAITNCNPRVYNTGNGGIIGIAGDTRNENDDHITLENITVDNSNKISALWGSYDVACGGLVGMYRGNVDADGNATGDTITFNNCHVAAQMDVYNDVCGNYQYYAYRYAGMIIGSVRHNTKNAEGKTIPNMAGIAATGCTVNYGDWNDYYYCEFVKNGHPSYSGPDDYKFSRVPNSEIDTTNGKENATCIGHNHTDVENNQAIYLPFHQLFTGYSWGVSSIGLKEYSGIVTDLDITEGDQEESVDKFVVKDDALDTYRPGYTYTIGDLFEAIDNAKVDIVDSSVYVSVSPATENDSVSGTYTPDSNDWTKGTITIDKDSKGSAKIIITDYYFCNVAVLIMNCEQAAEKFTAKTIEAQNAYTQIALGTLFDVKGDAKIGDVTATITDPKGNNTAVTGTAADWAAKTIDLTKDGAWTVAIQDDDAYCSATTVTFTVNKVDIFKKKFDKDFLYRVGNAANSPVTLGVLFDAQSQIAPQNVGVTIEKIAGNASGVFTSNATWTDGKIQFSGTGVVKLTISADGANAVELNLEVVDAVNATTATDATSNNVVLLSDIGSGFTVSGRYAVYGNGFTLNYTGNGQYLNNGLRQGIVNVSENGTLDNLRIEASIYPASYMYYDEVKNGPSSVEGDKTRYHYQLSAIAAKGNATISNCYAYGARTNIFVDTGNVTITDTVVECGTLANIQIQSTEASTVTLNNITTIQKQVAATIGNTSQVMMGAGIIVGPDTETNPNIVLNGYFKQYNWVNADDKAAVTNTTAQTIIQTALEATAFNHTINGKTASNLGIIYLNNVDAKVANNTGLPYEFGTVTMLGETGKVYSLQNATESQVYSNVEKANRDTVNGDYMPTFNFDLGDQEISYDGSEDIRYLYGDANGVKVLYKDGEVPLTLDLSKLATVYKYTGINYTCSAVCQDSSGNELTATDNIVTLDAQGEYTLIFTVEDNIFYNKGGEPITKSVKREYTVPLTLTVKAADIKNATVNITKNALDGVYITVNLSDYKLRVNFLDCISVTDYDNKGTGTTVSLTSNISSATLTPSSVNVFTTASTITVTYTDGRVLTVNLSKISGSSPGTKTATVNTSGSLYFITDGALNNKPTEASSQNICTITSVSYKGNSGSTVTNDTDVTVTWALDSSGGTSPCVTADTLVTLADGSVKRIDEVDYNDKLLVWNFYEGKYDISPAAIIFDHGADNNTVIELTFEDGTVVKVVNMHQFYDAELNKLITINADTVDSFVGHRFAKYNGTGTEYVELTSYSISSEFVEAWGIMTAEHYNIITAGMISADFDLKDVELFNYFEIGDDMKFDKAQMQADIEKYGLYTYDEFAKYLTYEQFVAFNVQYFKIPVGKGLYTFEGIIDLIHQYL